MDSESFHKKLNEQLKGAVIERVRPGGAMGELTVLDLVGGRTFVCGRLLAELERVQDEAKAKA